MNKTKLQRTINILNLSALGFISNVNIYHIHEKLLERKTSIMKNYLTARDAHTKAINYCPKNEVYHVFEKISEECERGNFTLEFDSLHEYTRTQLINHDYKVWQQNQKWIVSWNLNPFISSFMG